MELVHRDRSWRLGREGEELLRVSQWAEVRQMRWVEGLPLREIARRLALDVTTVWRAARQDEARAQRRSPPRDRRLDGCREAIGELLRMGPRISAKRIGSLLPANAPLVGERTLRE